MGWSPDGAWLLFTSDRAGSIHLWGLRFADGRPVGSPQVLKGNVGRGSSLGLTAAGSLYMVKGSSTRDFSIAAIDLDAGTLGPPVGFTKGFAPRPGAPAWSPDGESLVYPLNRQQLAIRSVTMGPVPR